MYYRSQFLTFLDSQLECIIFEQHIKQSRKDNNIVLMSEI